MSSIKVIDVSDEDEFEGYVNAYLEDGYKLLSSSCGFVNSENYGFSRVYPAILIKDDEKERAIEDLADRMCKAMGDP